MYQRQQKGWTKHLDFVLWDLGLLVASYLLAYFVREGNGAYFFSNSIYISTGVTLIFVNLMTIVLFDTMHGILRRGYFNDLIKIVEENLIIFGCVTIYLFSVKDSDQLSRIVLWMTMLLHIFTTFIVFNWWKRVLRHRSNAPERSSMLLVADRSMVSDVLQRFKKNSAGTLRISGIILTDDGTEESIEGIPVVSSLSEAPKYICREWIDEVYICTANAPRELLERCNEMGITVHRELQYIGTGQQMLEKIAGRRVLTSAMRSITPGQRLVKRAMDILGGLVGSLIAVVIIAVVGPRIRKASPGPILFKQERIGENGRHFKMYKLRSMVMDADEKKKELMDQNRNADGMMFKLDFDPRIIGNEILPDGTHKTGIGEFIRRTSLDEFPQFFNVLMGQMSLVGTRPPTVDEWEKYSYHHRKRLSIKPGITGLWQTSGRSEITDFEEVVRLDTDYINRWSVGLDIRIIIKTVRMVIRGEGAL